MAGPSRDETAGSDPKRAGVGGAGVGADQVDPVGGTEPHGPGADAGVTSGTRATATGANLDETEAIPAPHEEPRSKS